MSFQLSQDQTDAVQGICDALLDTDAHALAVLTGSAGTGKTTVVKELIQEIWAREPDINIELCASTHRAASVLSDVVGHEVITAHAAFKLKPSVTRFGKETLKPAGICLIPNGSVVVVDEGSMIGNLFLKAMVTTVQKKRLKILFVGDPYQLPPPKDICSIFDGTLATFTLTKVHRQAGGNPILEKAIEFREFIKGQRQDMPIIETNLNAAGEGITVLPHAEFVTQFVKKYMAYDAGAVIDTPLCTYTNESAINYNAMIRKAAYFLEDSIEPFYEDERLIANSIVKQGDHIVLTNNEIVFVKSFIQAEHCGIPGYSVRVSGDYNKFTRSREKSVFCPMNKGAADKVLNELKSEAIASKSKAAWVQFYDTKNSLADLRPPFAGTTHKAQGGTFPAVFIDRVNINKCRDEATKARLMYVALTRASKNVYVNV